MLTIIHIFYMFGYTGLLCFYIFYLRDNYRSAERAVTRAATAVKIAYAAVKRKGYVDMKNIVTSLQLAGVEVSMTSFDDIFHEQDQNNNAREEDEDEDNNDEEDETDTNSNKDESIRIDHTSSKSSEVDKRLSKNSNASHSKTSNSNSNNNKKLENEKEFSLNIRSASAKEDVWLRVQRYQKAVADSKEMLRRLAALSSREKRKVDVLVNRVRLFFLDVTRAFVNDQVCL